MLQTVVGAAIGIGGVAVGAWFTFVLNARAERARVAREAAREERSALGVRRLIVQELSALSLHLGYVATQEMGPGAISQASGRFLPTDEWPRLKDVLAETLREDVWAGLPPLYHNVEQLKARFAARPNDPLSDRDRARVAEMAEQAAVAAKLLGAVGDPHRVFVITDAEGRQVASSRGASLPAAPR